MDRLRAFFPQSTTPPETVAAYAAILVELNFEDCAAGCRNLVESERFLPSVAAIIAATRAAESRRLVEEARVRRDEEDAAYREEELVGPPPDAVAAMRRLSASSAERVRLLEDPQDARHHRPSLVEIIESKEGHHEAA